MTQCPFSLNSRHLAVEILNHVGQQNHTLDHWLDWSDTRHRELIPRDRAFIRSIVYGTIRWQSRLDWIIDQFATRPVSKIDPMVRTILRMGLFQLLYMDRVPVSAAVNTSVELAKSLIKLAIVASVAFLTVKSEMDGILPLSLGAARR